MECDALDRHVRATFAPARLLAWSDPLSTLPRRSIMEGYDTQLLNSFFAYPSFNRKVRRLPVPLPPDCPSTYLSAELDHNRPDLFFQFGTLQPDGSYVIPARWQTSLGMGSNIGSIIGLFINGACSDRFGYKKTFQCALFVMICTLFVPFFAPNVQTLMAGQILQGLPWGVFQTLTTAYASEICPVALRAYLTTYVNLCWVMGQLICGQSAIRVEHHLSEPSADATAFDSTRDSRYPSRSAQQHDRVGLQDPLRASVGLAGAHPRYVASHLSPLVACHARADPLWLSPFRLISWSLLRSRVSVVARPSRTGR